MVEDAEDIAAFFDVEDGFARSALYRPGGVGDGFVIPVLPSRPDRTATLFGQETLSDTGAFLIRVSDAAAPAAGDTLEVDGTVFTIQGEPARDEEQAVWRIKAYPAP
ncbi:MAG: hypothetical protein QNJ84_11890 [Alphaproteobacteria bacterium]|nr:hypothetical protein [Alphaproteobacteria bacterium]